MFACEIEGGKKKKKGGNRTVKRRHKRFQFHVINIYGEVFKNIL